MDAMLLQLLAQYRKDDLHQMIPCRMHVAKGADDENSDASDACRQKGGPVLTQALAQL